MFNWFKKLKNEEEKVEFKKIDDTFDNVERLMTKQNKDFYKELEDLAIYLKGKFFDVDNDKKLYENYVVGVEGRWGTGKTTFIRCLLTRLHDNINNSSGSNDKWYQKFDKDESKGHIVWLNPWAYSNKEDLQEYLISSISNNTDLDSRGFKSMNYYIDKISPNKKSNILFSLWYSVNTWTARLISLFLATVVATNYLFEFNMGSNFINYIRDITSNIPGLILFPMFAFLVFILYFVLSKLISYCCHKIDISTHPLSLKKSINKSLKKSNKRIVCVIDDIDRLSDDEIYDLFKSIKEVINFPNILFILAYDRSVLDASLDKRYPSTQKGEYLAKIVNKTVKVKTFVDMYILEDVEGLYTYSSDIINCWNQIEDDKSSSNLSYIDKFLFSKMCSDYEYFKALFNNDIFTIRDVKEHLKEVKKELRENNLRLDINIPLYIFIRLLKEKSYKNYEMLRSIQSKEFNDKFLSDITDHNKTEIKSFINAVFDNYLNSKAEGSSLKEEAQKHFNNMYLDTNYTYFNGGIITLLSNVHSVMDVNLSSLGHNTLNEEWNSNILSYIKHTFRKDKSQTLYLNQSLTQEERMKIDSYLRLQNVNHEVGSLNFETEKYYISGSVIDVEYTNFYEFVMLSNSLNDEGMNRILELIKAKNRGYVFDSSIEFEEKLVVLLSGYIESLDSSPFNEGVNKVLEYIINIQNMKSTVKDESVKAIISSLKTKYPLFIRDNKDIIPISYICGNLNPGSDFDRLREYSVGKLSLILLDQELCGRLERLEVLNGYLEYLDTTSGNYDKLKVSEIKDFIGRKTEESLQYPEVSLKDVII
tara:strand:- start:1071 stop:3518 length:2448 start_codon:yes stop_codon:yes gene_type:complete